MFDFIGHIFKAIGTGIATGLIAIAGLISPAPSQNNTVAPTPINVTVEASTTASAATTQPTTTEVVKVLQGKIATPTALPKPIVIPATTPPHTTPVTPVVTPPVQNTKPTITSFSVTPSTATLGDTVKFSWSASNVVSCAVPVSDPSTLDVPFKGHLPEGTLDYVVTASDITQQSSIWIVCADKDWNTVKQQTTLTFSGPQITGTPRTHYNLQGNKELLISFIGVSSAHVYCVNNTNSPANPPVIVDDVVVPNASHNATAAIKPDTLSGSTLGCYVDFGTAGGGKVNFSVGVQ